MPAPAPRSDLPVLLLDGSSDALAARLEAAGLPLARATDADALTDALAAHAPVAVVLGPDLATPALVERLAADLPVVALTAGDHRPLLAAGAFDVVDPARAADPDDERLPVAARNARQQGLLRRDLSGEGGALDQLVGSSPAFRAALEALQRAATGSAALLLVGEDGTGRRRAARAVHDDGPRRSAPLVSVDCATAPPAALHERLLGPDGALARAQGGSLVLERIDRLAYELQGPLEAALAAGDGTAPRLMAWACRDLTLPVERGAFDPDLHERLAVQTVALPPLRERGGDVVLLAEHIVRKLSRRHRRAVSGLTREAALVLERHDWPGNLTELAHVLERAVVLSQGALLERDALPDDLGRASQGPGGRAPSRPDEIVPFVEHERQIIKDALQATGWQVQEAARRLRLGRATLYRKIQRFGLR